MNRINSNFLQKSTSHLVICDPACVQPFGHNVAALRYFRDAFESEYRSISAICCNLLPIPDIETNGFLPKYSFYYQNYFPHIEVSADQGMEGAFISADPMEDIATRDADRLLCDLGITGQDDVLFPHLDFYGVVGMLNALAMRDKSARPRLLLRFIGVMENATPVYRSPFNELMTRIAVAIEDGFLISISAETPRYADVISKHLNLPVAVTGYPDEGRQMPLPKDGPFVFFCPGSARADKGFFELYEIFSQVRLRDADLSIRFVTQILPDADLKRHLLEASRLYSVPGVELIAASISSKEMTTAFEESHAVLLPYDKGIYKLRGSAVLMEAAAYGRPVIGYDGAAFSELITFYGLGTLANDRHEMIDQICLMASRNRREIEVTAMQARHRYRCSNLASYTYWMLES